MINKKVFYTILTIWTVIWLHFMLRELFFRGDVYDYMALLRRDLDGKRSYVTGDRLYELMQFSKERIPAGSSVDFIGIDEDSVDRVRLGYYLYPATIQKDPDYMVVFDSPQTGAARNYRLFAKLDDSRYVLKKR